MRFQRRPVRVAAVGALVDQLLDVDRGEAAVSVRGRSHVQLLVARVTGGHEIFHPVLDPPDGTSQPPSELHDDQFLG